jgi:hypothetical protein
MRLRSFLNKTFTDLNYLIFGTDPAVLSILYIFDLGLNSYTDSISIS